MQLNQLDPQIVNLTKAIRQQESGGKFDAVSPDGSYGAYQFIKGTWDATAPKYGVKAGWKEATPQQQNEVAYKQIAEWKGQGYNVGQIASMWNAGRGEPDAYLGKFKDGRPAEETNSYGIKYSVPNYAKAVATHYQYYKSQDPQPQTQSAPQQEQPMSVGGFAENVVKSTGHAIGGIWDAVTHPIDTIHNLGRLGAGAIENTLNMTGLTNYDNAESQMAADVGKYFAGRYGGSNPKEIADNILKTAYQDPAGVALDLSTLLSGGGALTVKAGQLADLSQVAKAGDLANVTKVGEVTQTVGNLQKAGQF